MIIHNLNKFPEGYSFPGEDISELYESELEDIERLEIDECWYWYAIGCYEGSGYVLMRKDDLYDLWNLGHCSCRGPTECISFWGQKLSILKDKCSKDCWNEVKELFNAAEELKTSVK